MDPYRAPAPTPLSAAIEALYHTFARYPLTEPMEACPCCVGADEQALLRSRPLRELSSEALGRYPGKAMTTWGGVDDFRHFLPRIFELVANDDLGRDPQTVIGRKLELAKWREWRAREQEAIEAFVIAWCDDWRTRAWLAPDALSTALLLGFDTSTLLDAWRDDQRSSADGAWLALLETLAYGRTLDPWTTPETSDVISRWLLEPPQRARLMRIIETPPEDTEPELPAILLASLEARLR